MPEDTQIENQIPATAPNTPASTLNPLTTDNAAVRSPAFSQTTHPSTTSHEPGELGRAAITEETKAGTGAGK